MGQNHIILFSSLTVLNKNILSNKNVSVPHVLGTLKISTFYYLINENNGKIEKTVDKINGENKC